MARNMILGLLTCFMMHAQAQENKQQKDVTSKVPQFTFSGDKDQQLEQLRTNPLLARFKASRSAQAINKHRPSFHFTSPEGRLNDPNGLCYWQGKWHLFYQAYPPEDPRQHWGHAVSDDLLNWTDLPYAIYPNPEEKVYSGTTWVEENRVIAMYHGVGAGTMVATSEDPLLLNWDKVTGQAVIPIPKPGEKLPYNVFDPNIWKKGDYYYTILAGTRPIGPGGKNLRANFLFRSEDLAHWEYLHPFVENDSYGLVGDDGACPYFWPIGNEGKYILLHFSHKSGGKYLLGDYDKTNDKFIVTDGGNFNHGPVSNGGVHAPSAFPDGKGGVVCIFNTNSGRPINPGNFTEMMTLPLHLSLDDRGKLAISTAADMSLLRGERQHIPSTPLPANREIQLRGLEGSTKELNLTIDMKKSTFVEIDVLASPDKQEYTRIMFYKDGGYPNREYPGGKGRYSAIAIDNSRSSISGEVRPRVTETANVWIEPGELLNLRIFIDKSIVEVFVNDKQYVALRAYPERDDSSNVTIRSNGNDAVLTSAEAWDLKTIYNNQ
ncbi:glycoside hydrolase family 32 protein [Parapedobacter defluvii]|uniref:glycoside hydrolase family 32 protein n=1 Tax=Parapedobacter defluvii TaxID=2045106 RepID=UPI00333F02EE